MDSVARKPTIRISGAGCTLLDFIFNHINFNSKDFKKYISKNQGDGGLSPGQLVFLEDLEKFAGESIATIIRNIIPQGAPSKESSYLHEGNVSSGRILQGSGEFAPNSISIGGPAIVSMIHAAQLLKGEAEINFYAAIGNDDVAEKLKSLCNETSPGNTSFISKPGRTPLTYVLSDPHFNNGEGERTFINSIGAAASLQPQDLPSQFYKADIITLGGTALVPGIHDQLDLLLDKIPKSSFRLVNTVFDFRSEKNCPGKQWPMGNGPETLEKIDMLIMDKEEAIRISGKRTLEMAARYFAESPVGSFIITNGPLPVIAGSFLQTGQDREINTFPVSRNIIEDLIQPSAGDTTGAGDNFAGGVIYSIASQISSGQSQPDLDDAIAWGIVSGGFACSHLGGIYKEMQPGEKLNILKKYYHLYKMQLENQ